MDKKIIDDIVWWIPIKNLRNNIRVLLSDIDIKINSLTNTNTNIDLICSKSWANSFHLMFQYMIDNPVEFNKQLNKFKENLDVDSLKILDIWLLQLKSFVNLKYPCNGFYINYAVNFFTDEQKIVWANRDIIFSMMAKRYEKKYRLEDINLSFNIHYYEAGIVYLPTKVKEKFRNSIAIDCGAYIGDSAIMFLEEYGFLKIHAFEPVYSIYNKLENNIKKYNLKEKIIPHKLAVSNIDDIAYIRDMGEGSSLEKKCEYIEGVEKIETVGLDNYLKDETNISLIKLDIEGFEEQALLGAENIIKKYKPVLLISCYHDHISHCQMFRLKDYIENLNLGYKIIFRGLAPNSNLEYNLICYVE